MSGSWDEILRHGRPVRELRDVAPGDVVFLENADASLMVAYRAGGVVRCDGLTHLYVAGLTGRKYTLGGASTMRFRGARRQLAMREADS